MSSLITIKLRVNGQSKTVVVSPDTPLLYILRNDLGLTSAKFGCGLGECGACTVLVNGVAARSCVTTCGAVQDYDIVTLEGLTTDGNPCCGSCGRRFKRDGVSHLTVSLHYAFN